MSCPPFHSHVDRKLKVKGVSREFQEPQIQEIKVKYSDPIRNGVGWGALIGGISGAVLGEALGDAFCDDCGDGSGMAAGAISMGSFGVGIGSGTGAIADSLKRTYTPVFKAPKIVDKGIGVSPLLSK